ncbi:2-dehydro-3-deoxyphosphogluconate aldolase/(4S)-4-hydroxy-2-oxoglutarate aldolase [Ruminiclostridium sufflavum DSM 19573]|uniref:2-dehydro-3-deoxy-phosphogluconate aldolase n=1 Tax=Ruminiclostridium sufflavum DSM 19573 TaxID=1121337 RepID=A0A318XIU5_9FIRM|nr:bifunctional 4-hydroxy-2-oxoglutarate aldolase/2-dehydro-3-deoxy-phosphogluconate aldolase [Ruminiclostridium sufflavum]PYG85851.1 2-dehydro-3-deoxyphosphogluconate aldolase/(4S)-4-hydroxy-2-oxoglutarate aldolase [Ruminiclostridium sufflavum DSM 19573]
MHEILSKISLIGIVPVVKINDTEKAVPLAKALSDGGIPAAEITFRTEQAEEAIVRITKEMPDVLVGAGTVLTTEQADRAIKAGAGFVVSPGLNPQVVAHCMQKGIPVIPGCSNPSDIEQAMALGLDVVKFFPAEAAGGVKMLKALSGPYGNMKFMPTGGITADNVNDYLSFSKVIACGGSWMVPENLIKQGNFEKITILAREAMESILGFKLSHVGINCEKDEQAGKVAASFSSLLNLDLYNGGVSIFAGNAAGNIIEVMKTPYKGRHGHIAIKTNYIERAVNYITGKGYKFDQSTAKYDLNNKLQTIYLESEVGGFAIHLVQ